MTPQEITDRLKAQLGEKVVDAKLDGVPDPFVKVAPAAMHDAAVLLRNDPDLEFDFLMCLSGVDNGKGILGVVYHLYSMTKRHKITVKTDIPVADPAVASVASVWPGADWHEREAYDMFGMTFTGHPDHRRILLPEDYPGHPLRKDFKVPEFYQGMKVPY